MDPSTRRHFLLGGARAAGVSLLTAVLVPGGGLHAARVVRQVNGRTDDDLAQDEDFWLEIQRSFAVDRSLINLNNGGVSPAPGVVMDAMRRFDEYSNHAPARTMWRDLQPEYETVRSRLARVFGCDAEEVAITRNATEALDNLIFGVDLAPGDEVLTTNQDYPTMLSAWRHRVARHGVVLRTVALPTPAPSLDALARVFEENLSDRTRVVLLSHVVNLTGQILPVRRIVDRCRDRGIEVFVDGAHSFCQVPFARDDLDCDYFGTSLHKWLCGPIGSGMLYVRSDKVKSIWPLFGQMDVASDDVRKFEAVGTHPASHRLAISEALVFHEAIGAARKAARLRFLRDRWALRFKEEPRVRFHAKLDAADSCSFATIGIDGIDPGELTAYLWRRHCIVTSPVIHEDVNGVRVTPSIYTTTAEVDLFGEALSDVLEHGLEGEPRKG